LDRLFIARIESALDYPIQSTIDAVGNAVRSNPAFKRDAEKWMRDSQGWVISEATERQNIEHAARFTCYVLVNRLCFFNALRRKYPRLRRLTVPNNVATGRALQQKLSEAFNEAKRFTGNYETVFDGDFGDSLPFLADQAVPDWRSLIRSLDHYDFAHIGLDVIGAMYEQLIKPAERHRYGQHYTQPAVVDPDFVLRDQKRSRAGTRPGLRRRNLPSACLRSEGVSGRNTGSFNSSGIVVWLRHSELCLPPIYHQLSDPRPN
jgi:hypothetical protein